MAYCKNCGTEISEQAYVCPQCGVKTGSGDDSNSGLWGLLGFFYPIAGLVLYITWKATKPKSSKAAGIGAIIGAAISALSFIITLATIF
ncbi:MAG: zinc-ribbon domain-containing protein [Clostridiales bacterium]|jgi:hypothetical protein|nr:zinc-ribbon domain-containing protein [Clostridiales bacterium]